MPEKDYCDFCGHAPHFCRGGGEGFAEMELLHVGCTTEADGDRLRQRAERAEALGRRLAVALTHVVEAQLDYPTDLKPNGETGWKANFELAKVALRAYEASATLPRSDVAF